MNKLLLNIDRQIEEFLATIKHLETEREELLDKNFELQAQVKALTQIRHEEITALAKAARNTIDIGRRRF